jgi:hypothetical protein
MRNSTLPKFTKRRIKEYAKGRGLTFAQTALYSQMLERGTSFIRDNVSGFYYTRNRAGHVDRRHRVHWTTALGMIAAKIMTERRDGLTTIFELRKDAKPT